MGHLALVPNSSPSLLGEGDRGAKRRGGGAMRTPKNPSTMLRMVPLPGKSRGGCEGDRP